MDSNLSTLAARAQATLSTIAAVQSTIDSSNTQITSLGGELTVLQSSVRTLTSQNSALQAEVDGFNAIVVFKDLERTPWFLAPGAAGNTGAVGSLATATQAQPSASSAWFNIAPLGPFANAYYYKVNGADIAKKNYTYKISFLFNTLADSNASQAVELDIQQVIGGVVYNTGWQFDFAEKIVRTWNRSGKAWVSTGIPCPRWTPGKWIDIFAESHRDATNVYADAITIGGSRTPVNLSFPAPSLGLSDMLNCAVQLDGNSTATAYKLYIDNVDFQVS